MKVPSGTVCIYLHRQHKLYNLMFILVCMCCVDRVYILFNVGRDLGVCERKCEELTDAAAQRSLRVALIAIGAEFLKQVALRVDFV